MIKKWPMKNKNTIPALDNEQTHKHSYVPPTTSYPPMPKITSCEIPSDKDKTEGLFFRTADGQELTIREVKGLEGTGTVLFMLDCYIKPADMADLEERYSKKLKTPVVLLEPFIRQVLRLDAVDHGGERA